MANSESEDIRVDVADSTLDSETAEAFALLGNETRLAILLALWEAYDPHEAGDELSFSALREAVGVRQGAQFNYHLEKLVGQFVEKTDDGYRLRRSGLMLVQSIIAGTTADDPDFEDAQIDAECPFCGAGTYVTYENRRVLQVCPACDGYGEPDDNHPAGTLVGWTMEPTGLTDRGPEELLKVSTIKTFARIGLRFEGICPECSGPVDWSMDVCDDHEIRDGERCPACGRMNAISAKEVCQMCKSSGHGSPGIKTLLHPAVVSFLYEHGIEAGFSSTTDVDDVITLLELVTDFEEEVVSTDPLRVQVRVSQGDAELGVLLDRNMSVLEVTERSP